MITILINSLCIFFLLVSSSCQVLKSTPQVPVVPKIKEAHDLKQLLEKFEFSSKEVSFLFKELKGDKLYSLNEDEERIPASLNKIFTLFFTLKHFSLQHRFKTLLKYKGSFSKTRKILNGDLCLVGQGDPDLDYDDLMSLALRLKDYGVRKVSGNILFDDSYFLPHGNIFDFPETSESYNQSFSGLNLAKNRFHYVWDLENREIAPVFSSSPNLMPIPQGRAISELENFSFIDGAWFFDRTSSIFQEQGKERLPVKNSGEFSGESWKKILEDAGIEVSSLKAVRHNCHYRSGFRVLFSHEGRELEDLLHESFLFSDNLVMELLSMHAAKKRDSSINLRSKALDNMKQFYNRHFGIPMENLNIDRASGLTDKARIAPWVFAKVLEKSFRRYGKRHVLSLFPLLGFSGTLRKRLNSSYTDLRVWAKTGTVNFASNIAGYIVHQGRIYVFAIMLNNLPKRFELQAEKEKSKKKLLDDNASQWIKRARNFQDELIELFAKSLDNSKSISLNPFEI